MPENVLIIIGSASQNSSNRKLVDYFIASTADLFNSTVFEDLKSLPHFDPELSNGVAPDAIVRFRDSVEKADAVFICTPEYIYSVPSGLKNALEWCVSTTVFSEKPLGIITASAHGQKGHEELQLIMQTLMARFNPETTLLIQGVKGKVSVDGEIKDDKTRSELDRFIIGLRKMMSVI